MQQLMPKIPVLGELRQEDCYKFKTNLGYRVRSCLNLMEGVC